MKIGIFDSGRGGTTVMSAIQQLLPSEDYFYIADSEHCPYGEKSDSELYRITVRCIQKLRRDYPSIRFIGTEPAIKLATTTGAHEILVLATPGTIASERTLSLIHDYATPAQHFTLLPCPGLADTIEHYLDTAPDRIDIKLAELFRAPLPTPDLVVLGCTHYPLIISHLKKYFPTAKFIDGGEGVAREVARVKSLISS